MDSVRRNRIKILLYCLTGLSAAAITVSTIGLFSNIQERGQGKAFYASLAPAHADRAAAQPSEKLQTQVRGLSWEKNMTANSPDIENKPNLGLNIDGEILIEETRTPLSQWQPYVDFARLREDLPDITAWIECEGIGIDFPVVQGKDNTYYLSRLPNGERNNMGSVFMDYRNSEGFSDKNTMIYGHALTSGQMFAVLKKYQEQAFYAEHPVLRLYTPDGDYEIVLIAGYIVDSSKKEDVPPLEFKDETAFEQYISAVKKRSTFISGVNADADDKLVSLATCAYTATVYRYVLVGKLVECT